MLYASLFQGSSSYPVSLEMVGEGDDDGEGGGVARPETKTAKTGTR